MCKERLQEIEKEADEDNNKPKIKMAEESGGQKFTLTLVGSSEIEKEPETVEPANVPKKAYFCDICSK